MVDVCQRRFVDLWNVTCYVSLVSLEAHSNFCANSNLRKLFSWSNSSVTWHWFARAEAFSLLKVNWVQRFLKLVLSSNTGRIQTWLTSLVLLLVIQTRVKNALILRNRVVKSMRLINVACTLGQTHLLSLNNCRGRYLWVVFLVSYVVYSWSRNRIGWGGCRLSWRLAIETKKVSQVFAKLTSTTDASIRNSSTCAFDRSCCTGADGLLLNDLLLRQDHGRLDETFLVVELLKSSWWVRRWCGWNDWGVYSAEWSLSILRWDSLRFVRLACLEKSGLLRSLWRNYFWNQLWRSAAEETAWNSTWDCTYTTWLSLRLCGLLAAKYSMKKRPFVLLPERIS